MFDGLKVDAEAKTLTLVNPLYGKQVTRCEEMEDYGLNKAVFETIPNSTWIAKEK